MGIRPLLPLGYANNELRGVGHGKMFKGSQTSRKVGTCTHLHLTELIQKLLLRVASLLQLGVVGAHQLMCVEQQLAFKALRLQWGSEGGHPRGILLSITPLTSNPIVEPLSRV